MSDHIVTDLATGVPHTTLEDDLFPADPILPLNLCVNAESFLVCSDALVAGGPSTIEASEPASLSLEMLSSAEASELRSRGLEGPSPTEASEPMSRTSGNPSSTEVSEPTSWSLGGVFVEGGSSAAVPETF